MYNSIKKYYDQGRYTKDQVKVFVQAGWITADEYKKITGDDYVEPETLPYDEEAN